MDVELTFINQSNDVSGSEVVILSHNVATYPTTESVAWIVIKHCGHGDSHPFTWPAVSEVTALDSYGNYMAPLVANAGDAFEVVLTGAGDEMTPVGQAASPNQIEVTNNLTLGSINVDVKKDGKLFAIVRNVVPTQKAVFEFKPTIWIGATSQVDEGYVINEAALSQIQTEISLLGVASADIVMTGGGAGPDSEPLIFLLQNVVYA